MLGKKLAKKAQGEIKTSHRTTVLKKSPLEFCDIIFVQEFVQDRGTMNFSAALLLLLSASTIVTVDAERILHENERVDYEIWAADQSSSISNQTTLGARGGLLWVWKHMAILDQVNNKPLPCKPGATNGPCDIFDIFPGNLAQMNSTGAPTGFALDQLPNFGTWHGIMKDATNMYVAVALFTKGYGYVGIIDTRTRGGVALFRATKYDFTGAAAGGDPLSSHAILEQW